MSHRYDTRNPKAWALIVRGNEQITIYRPDSNRKAREYYEAALEEDTNSAHALAFLGLTHLIDARFGWAKNPGEARAAADELVERALAINPDFPEALSVKALGLMRAGDYDGALAYGRRVVAVAPSAAEALAQVAIVEQYAGYPERAIKLYSEARRLHPRHHWWYLLQLMVAYRDAGKYDKVLATVAELRQLLIERGLAGRAETWIGPEEALANYHLGNRELARENVANTLQYAAERSSVKGLGNIASLRHLHPYRDPTKAEAEYAILMQLGMPENP